VYFPREILVLSAVVVCLVDTLVGSVVLIALMGYYRIGPGLALSYLPIVILVHASFTIGVGLFLSMANLFYRDVKYLFELVVTLWMFATSVLYPSNLVGGTAGLVLRLNPMTAIIDAYRDVLLYGRAPFSPAFAWASLIAVLTLIVTSIIFHRTEFKFAESV
jgi:lipopolysaccharide transport system permease protein